MEIIVYEMKYVKEDIEKSTISCIPFESKYFQEYMKIYNTCFKMKDTGKSFCFGQ